jgi:hypothetical protein
MNLAKQLAAISLLALAGCASNPGVVATGNDTYTLSRTDRGGSFGDLGTTKADLVREANQFAAGRGKAAVQVAMKENHLIAPEGYTNVTYEFRLVDPAEARAVEVKAAAEPVVKAAPVAVPAAPVAVGQGKDLYGELLRYDDLRKRGIITDAEFDQIKKKLLNGG